MPCCACAVVRARGGIEKSKLPAPTKSQLAAVQDSLQDFQKQERALPALVRALLLAGVLVFAMHGPGHTREALDSVKTLDTDGELS